MRDTLEHIDRLLADITLKGDDLMKLANARLLLKEVYDSMKNAEETDG